MWKDKNRGKLDTRRKNEDRVEQAQKNHMENGKDEKKKKEGDDAKTSPF